MHVCIGDYGSSSEYIDVIINKDSVRNRCIGLIYECINNTRCRFDNNNNNSYGDYYLDISKYIDSNKKSNALSITLDSSSGVDGFCSGANLQVIRAYVTITCDIYGNFTYSPTHAPSYQPTYLPTFPTFQPTFEPTASPTNETIDYHLTLDGKNGIYSDTQYLTCGKIDNDSYISGCSITATWKINGQCYNGQLYTVVLPGDFGSTNEYIDIIINDDIENENRCYELTEECGNNNTDCMFDNFNNNTLSDYLDISDYIDLNKRFNLISVTLDASNIVDGFCIGANNNVIRAYVTILCDIYGNFTSTPTNAPSNPPTDFPTVSTAQPTIEPTTSPTNKTVDYYFEIGKNDEYNDTRYLTCGNVGNDSSGCQAVGVWRIKGICDNAKLYVSVFPGDFGATSEYINVDINNDIDNSERCWGLINECGILPNTLCRFDNNDSIDNNFNYFWDYDDEYGDYYLDISDYIDSNKENNLLIVTLNASSAVDLICSGVKNNSIIRAYVTIGCDNNDNKYSAPIECEIDGNLRTVDWQNLLSESDNDGILVQNQVSGYIEDNEIGVRIRIESDYIVTSKYDIIEDYYSSLYENTIHQSYLPITYLITFEQFNDFDVRRLNKPGSCDSRLASSYESFNSSIDYIYNYWTFSLEPENNLGNDNFMEYPEGNIWNITFTVSNDTNASCGRVTWTTSISLSDMLNINNDGCIKSDGVSNVFTFVDDTENGIISLESVLYMYLVSPDPAILKEYYDDSSSASSSQIYTIDYMQRSYLYHAIISYPISINFNTVSSYSVVSNDINIDIFFGNTIYGTNYDENKQILSIDILTFCPEFMIFILEDGYYNFQGIFPMFSGTNVSFIDLSPVYYGDELEFTCLTISNGRCFQKFRVQFLVHECNADLGGVKFDNHYLMWLTSLPRNTSSNSDVSNWLETIDVTSINETKIIFFDLLEFDYTESCESFNFDFNFNSNITFFHDNSYSTSSLITLNNPLFVFNSGNQRLYVEIELESRGTNDLLNANIIDMSILDVWFCVYDSNDTNLTGSCFDSSSTSSGSSVGIWYLYSATTTAVDKGYMSDDDIINDTNNNIIEQFSFIIPVITNTNVNRFGVQINVELSLISGSGRRVRRRRSNVRMLLDGDSYSYNYDTLGQTFNRGTITVDDESRIGNSNNRNENIFGKADIMYYMIFALGVLLIIAFCVIGYLYNKQKNSVNTAQQHAQSIEMGTGKIGLVNDDQETGPVPKLVKQTSDDIIVTKDGNIAF